MSYSRILRLTPPTERAADPPFGQESRKTVGMTFTSRAIGTHLGFVDDGEAPAPSFYVCVLFYSRLNAPPFMCLCYYTLD